MSGFDSVRRELDLWHRQRRTAQFWWRDDDAQDISQELSGMLGVAREHGVAIGLSVIPAKVKPRLAAALKRERHAQVLVHGLAHQNHAREAQAKCEFGGARSLDEIIGDLTRGISLLRGAFGADVLPVLVPPWNRIRPQALRALPKLGYRGISTWKPRPSAKPVAGLVQVNTHLDVIDWRRGRVLKDERLIASLLLRKLRWRREKRARAEEPLGILTHHAYWSAEKERLIGRFLEATRGHPAVRWHTPKSAFGL